MTSAKYLGFPCYKISTQTKFEGFGFPFGAGIGIASLLARQPE
jgi:hypothetical protein